MDERAPCCVIFATLSQFFIRATVLGDFRVWMSRTGNKRRQTISHYSGDAVINTSLLREFITNPFGDEQKARELLTEIEGHELSAAELARGEFCFQVAFYFVVLRAIDATIADPSVRKAFLSQLHERLRAFYARDTRPVSCTELAAAPAERERIEVALRQAFDEPAPANAIPEPTPTVKLALFDLVGMPRLEQYQLLAGEDRFRALAQLLLLHYGARPYHPMVIDVVADLLAANYTIACEIVGSSLEVINTRRNEREAAPLPPLPLAPGMPDLVDRKPRRAWRVNRYALLLFDDVAPMGGKANLRFRYVLALCDRATRRPLCLVTLENSRSLADILCVFEASGAHSNYGSLQGHGPREFMGKAVILLRDRFDLPELETLGRPEESAVRATKKIMQRCGIERQWTDLLANCRSDKSSVEYRRMH